GFYESTENSTGTIFTYYCFIAVGLWQYTFMIETESEEESCQNKERDTPSILNAACPYFKSTYKHHQQALAGNCGNAVESAADTYIKCLVLYVECQHVESVCSNIMCSRAECH